MPSSFKIDRIDRAGMVEMLKSKPVQRLLTDQAGQIAARVTLPRINGPQPAKVRVNKPHDATFSAATSVSIAHPAGMAIEAKYAPLRKAAGGGS